MNYEHCDFIDEGKINEIIGHRAPSPEQFRVVLQKAMEMKGLSLEEMAILTAIDEEELLDELFAAANKVKNAIYGRRLVIFAPLYISNLCANECLYCAFRATNKSLVRRALTQPEITRETQMLISQGHKRVLLVAGESYPREGFDYVLKSIRTVYETKNDKGEIRRVNVNVAPLSVDDFRLLKAEKIGTYQIFQETYHRGTYNRVHIGGKKRNFDWRVTAPHRAMQAGIDDVGIGILFGLHDYRFELLAMKQHIESLEREFGIGPHTISVPRMEPAGGSDMASHPPVEVTDNQFRKIVAILRLAVPYTGIIMSTRETARMRRESFALGVSQISAGSRTNPGGYSNETKEMDASQFSLGDHRPLDEVIRDVASMGYIPSFCTACYRLGRTGRDFMDLAKPGDIKLHCDPNALSTFREYLLKFASPGTVEVGNQLIAEVLSGMSGIARQRSVRLLQKVQQGKTDVFC